MKKANQVDLRAAADKEERAGRYLRAIELLREIADHNPYDWSAIKKIGDLYARLNRNREAIVEWTKVADYFAKDGFLLKSIALWKQVNKLDPSAVEPALNLADLYAKQGLLMEAKSQYQVVVDEYIKRGKMRDAGDVLKKMADIDPSDLRIRSRLADLYPRLGYPEKAIEEHIAIAEELNKKGHLAEALQVLERGLKIDAKNNRLRLELARIHLVQKNYERAVHYLEEAVERASSDPRVLLRLGEAYVGAKKAEDAEIIFRRLIKLDPNDHESRVQMGRVYLLQGLFDKAYEEFLPVVEKLLERKDVDQAAALLQQVVQRNSAHVPSLVKLVDMYRSFQRDTAAATTYSQLTEAYLAEGQIEKAEAVLEMLVSMEPQNQQHKTKLWFVRSKQPRSAPPATVPAPPTGESPVRDAVDSDIPTRLRPPQTSLDLEIEQLLLSSHAQDSRAEQSSVPVRDHSHDATATEKEARPPPTQVSQTMPGSITADSPVSLLSAAAEFALAGPFEVDEQKVLERHIARALRQISEQRRLQVLRESIAVHMRSGAIRVFLCHASEDKPAVRDLYRRLKEQGVAAWLDEEDIIAGMNWEAEIDKAVRASDIVLVCLSRLSVQKRGFVQTEVKRILEMADQQPEDSIFLIPLLLEPCEVPARLQKWHRLGYYEEGAHDKLMKALEKRAEEMVLK